MRITVLGKSPSWQDAGGACSGYLVEEGDTCLLLDCGSGVFSKLRLFRDYLDVDAIVVSHLHADHFLDLIPFAYALTFSPRRATPAVRPTLYAPTGAGATLRRVAGAWGNEDLIERAFDLVEYDTAAEPRVGSLRVRFREVPHFILTHAVEIAGAAGAGARITYGADHGPTAEITDFAAGTDLLLLEATLAQPDLDGPRGHMTPAEAGDHGRRAAARRLVLTHLSDELDEAAARRQAEVAFGAPVEVAREGAVYTV